MSIWQHYNKEEKLVMLQQTSETKKIVEQAVEKDWWVSVVLMALSKTSWADLSAIQKYFPIPLPTTVI